MILITGSKFGDKSVTMVPTADEQYAIPGVRQQP